MLPIAFKVRGGGNYSGTKGGAVRPNEKGGTGALWYIDKTFTIASTQDQFIATSTIQERTEQPMTTQPSTPQVPLRFLSVCSGMEAASVAWEPLGWKAVGFSEIEPFPCAVLAHRFPNTTNYGSLTEYQSWPLSIGDVDLLCGGTPCQSYSVAGKRGGLNDPRGQLMLSFLDLAAKLQPKWILWENVPGVLSSGQPRGADFATFLQGLVERGYGWAYRVLDAQYVGRCGMHSQGQGWDAVPQRRRRVFVVACRGAGGWESAASVLLKPESLCWHPAPRRKKGQATAADAGAGVEAGRGCWWDGGQVSQTLHAVLQKGQTMPEKNRFPAVLQPVVIDRAAFNQGENAQYEPHIEQTDVMDSLVARGPHAVYPINTLTLGGRPDPVNDRRMTMGVGADGDPQFTLQAAHSHAIATAMAVRRLTPVECERLQGFPDNWSQIPWKGKPADQCPDGPRYKCAGNSMAVPVMRWIGEQIARVELSLNNPTK